MCKYDKLLSCTAYTAFLWSFADGSVVWGERSLWALWLPMETPAGCWRTARAYMEMKLVPYSNFLVIWTHCLAVGMPQPCHWHFVNKQAVLGGDKWIILNVTVHCFRVPRRGLILSCWLGYSTPILHDEIISSSYIQKCQSCLFLQSPIAMLPWQVRREDCVVMSDYL